MSPEVARLYRFEAGQSTAALPTYFRSHFLGDLNCIVNLDTKISNRALDLRVAQQQLHRAQVAGSPIDKRRLGSTWGVRAKLERIEVDARNPVTYKAGVLARREAMTVATATGEQELTGLASGQSEIFVDGLPCLLGQLKPKRAAGFFWRTVARSSV